ncbi:unnamed protein product, partial [Strongylus vulgaris]
IGAEICAQVNESPAWDYLDAPILRVTGVDVPMPYAHHLEDAALPNAGHIVATVKKSLNVNLSLKSLFQQMETVLETSFSQFDTSVTFRSLREKSAELSTPGCLFTGTKTKRFVF